MTEDTKKMKMLEFGQRVKYYREQLGLTQKELGIKAGYVNGTNPASSIYKIENGQMEVTQTKIYELAEALEIEVYELITAPQVSRLIKYAVEVNKMELSAKREKGNLAKTMEQQNEIPVLKRATE